jgi:hypothetical protein
MTAEQQARDMLHRMGLDGAQWFKSGDIVELVNLIESHRALSRSACRYPECTENEDDTCSKWLTGECEGPTDKEPQKAKEDQLAKEAIDLLETMFSAYEGGVCHYESREAVAPDTFEEYSGRVVYLDEKTFNKICDLLEKHSPAYVEKWGKA